MSLLLREPPDAHQQGTLSDTELIPDRSRRYLLMKPGEIDPVVHGHRPGRRYLEISMHMLPQVFRDTENPVRQVTRPPEDRQVEPALEWPNLVVHQRVMDGRDDDRDPGQATGDLSIRVGPSAMRLQNRDALTSQEPHQSVQGKGVHQRRQVDDPSRHTAASHELHEWTRFRANQQRTKSGMIQPFQEQLQIALPATILSRACKFRNDNRGHVGFLATINKLPLRCGTA